MAIWIAVGHDGKQWAGPLGADNTPDTGFIAYVRGLTSVVTLPAPIRTGGR